MNNRVQGSWWFGTLTCGLVSGACLPSGNALHPPEGTEGPWLLVHVDGSEPIEQRLLKDDLWRWTGDQSIESYVVDLSPTTLRSLDPYVDVAATDEVRFLEPPASLSECLEGGDGSTSAHTYVPMPVPGTFRLDGAVWKPIEAPVALGSYRLTLPRSASACGSVDLRPFGEDPSMFPSDGTVIGRRIDSMPLPEQDLYINLKRVRWVDDRTLVTMTPRVVFSLQEGSPYRDDGRQALPIETFLPEPGIFPESGPEPLRYLFDGLTISGSDQVVLAVSLWLPDGYVPPRGLEAGAVVEATLVDGQLTNPRTATTAPWSIRSVASNASGEILAVGDEGLVLARASSNAPWIRTVIPAGTAGRARVRRALLTGFPEAPHLLVADDGSVMLGDAFHEDNPLRPVFVEGADVDVKAASVSTVDGRQTLWLLDRLGLWYQMPLTSRWASEQASRVDPEVILDLGVCANRDACGRSKLYSNDGVIEAASGRDVVILGCTWILGFDTTRSCIRAASFSNWSRGWPKDVDFGDGRYLIAGDAGMLMLGTFQD